MIYILTVTVISILIKVQFCFDLNWNSTMSTIFRLNYTFSFFDFIVFSLKSSRVATRDFYVRLLHAFAISKYLRWFEPIKAISLKTQQHAVNARWKRLWQRAFSVFCMILQMLAMSIVVCDVHNNENNRKLGCKSKANIWICVIACLDPAFH